MPEQLFKTFIEHIEKQNKTNCQESLKFFCEPYLYFSTLAVWNEEIKQYLYLTKNDLVKLTNNEKIAINEFYIDINCRYICPLKNLPIEISRKQLVITLRAHRRFLAYSVLNNQVYNNVSPDLMLKEEKLVQYYCAKDCWSNLETACILLRIDPQQFINITIDKNLSNEWRIAFQNRFKFIINQIYQGYYDEVPDENLILHAQREGHLLFLSKIFEQIFNMYDIVSTWKEQNPLEVFNKYYSLTPEINYHFLNKNYGLLLKFIKQSKDNHEGNFANDYKYLNKILEECYKCQNQKVLENNIKPTCSLEQETTKQRNDRYQNRAYQLQLKNPTWLKDSIAEQIKQEEGDMNNIDIKTIKRNFKLKKTRR